MRPTAYLVNTARGPIVDQRALARALEDGWIAGAALDVTEPEPLPADDPLLAAPNLLVIPHLGSATERTRAAMADLAVDNLIAGLAGRPLPASVNPGRAYDPRLAAPYWLTSTPLSARTSSRASCRPGTELASIATPDSGRRRAGASSPHLVAQALPSRGGRASARALLDGDVAHRHRAGAEGLLHLREGRRGLPARARAARRPRSARRGSAPGDLPAGSAARVRPRRAQRSRPSPTGARRARARPARPGPSRPTREAPSPGPPPGTPAEPGSGIARWSPRKPSEEVPDPHASEPNPPG